MLQRATLQQATWLATVFACLDYATSLHHTFVLRNLWRYRRRALLRENRVIGMKAASVLSGAFAALLAPCVAYSESKAASLTAGGQWEGRQEASEFTNDTNVYLSIESTNASVCGRNRDDKVVLWVRCREDTTSVLFQTSCHMTSSSYHDYGDVHVSFDGGSERMVPMTKSRDNFALGLWLGNDSIPFVRQMFGSHEMTVRMKPFDEDAFTVSFAIAGLEEAILPLRQACHW